MPDISIAHDRRHRSTESDPKCSSEAEGLPGSPEHIIRARGLGHKYAGDDWLFRDLDLTVGAGEIVTVLGPNARGKTTLLSCLTGIRDPREGTVDRRARLGYVPQTHAADHPFSAHEMVVMGRAGRVRAWSAPSRADREAAWLALDRVGMSAHGATSFRELSGGQRQLVLMARALVADPGAIVLDEPTSALDLRNQRRVLNVIRDLGQDGIGVLFTTHDPTHALHFSERTLVMDHRIEFGRTGDLLTAERLSVLYRTPIVTAPVGFRSGTRDVVAADLFEIEPVPGASATADSLAAGSSAGSSGSEQGR